MIEPAEFDWAGAIESSRPVRIRTFRGNTVIGRVKAYIIWRPSSWGTSPNWVRVKGISSTHPGELHQIECEPLGVKAL